MPDETSPLATLVLGAQEGWSHLAAPMARYLIRAAERPRWGDTEAANLLGGGLLPRGGLGSREQTIIYGYRP